MENKRSVTIRDVAKRAGVSIATVSRYINKTAPVSKEVGQTIQSAMRELNFIPNSAARKLATNQYATLGLLLSDVEGDFFSVLVTEIEKDARAAGYDLLISISRDDSVKTGTNAFPIGPQNTDGMIIFADCASDNDLKYYYFNRYPVVLISRTPPPAINIPSVGVENLRAAKAIMRHLIEVHGRRKIVFLRGRPTHEDSAVREIAYKSVLAENNIPFNANLVYPGEFDRHVAYQSVLKLLEKGVDFDAIFACDDESAIGAMAALHDQGIDIPEKVSLVGFDDQTIAPFLYPSLTTIHAPFAEVGKIAVEYLIKQINHQAVDSLTLIPSELVIRHSCGC
ncbi:MAG: LacI family transcriptional regulator [Chloroflexota bacterium]|nr:LacI family transcriptional regulator [Chloroflexota bacterium]